MIPAIYNKMLYTVLFPNLSTLIIKHYRWKTIESWVMHDCSLLNLRCTDVGCLFVHFGHLNSRRLTSQMWKISSKQPHKFLVFAWFALIAKVKKMWRVFDILDICGGGFGVFFFSFVHCSNELHSMYWVVMVEFHHLSTIYITEITLHCLV